MAHNHDKPHLHIDYTNMLTQTIGPEHGIARQELDKLRPALLEAHSHLKAKRAEGKLPFMDLPYQADLAAQIRRLADELSGQFDQVLVLGIGGSALGPMTLHQALNPAGYNLLDKGVRKYPQIFFNDNVDPDELHHLLQLIDPKRCLLVVVTKSGSTTETMSSFLILHEIWVKALGKDKYARQVVAVTDPAKGDLRRLVQAEGFRTLDIPPGVGGRFSVFTPVGLFPAAMVGIDIAELLAGAAAMDEIFQQDTPEKNPVLACAGLQYLADTAKHLPISVLMPYSAQLRLLTGWFVQLWAESLGKKFDLQGRQVNVGPTPLSAVGTTDQHSQLQLFMEGPYDKLVAFIRIEEFANSMPIKTNLSAYDGLNYQAGHTLAELINAEQTATALALTNNGRPNYTISLPRLNAFTLGQLLQLLMLQTAVAGELYGINAYDQPGVEEGKQATYALMGRAGYEEKRQQIERLIKEHKCRL